MRASSLRALPLGRLALRGFALVLSLAAWHLAATYRLDLGFVTFRNVPTPTAAAQAAWALLHAPALPIHLGTSLARVTEAPLPREVAGHITVEPENARFGFRPVYFSGRQRDGSRVWSSAQFITFEGAGGGVG